MKIKKNLIGFEPNSEMFCEIRSKGRFTNIIMLSAHAMTRDKDEMAGNGHRLLGKEEDCTGSHSPQWTIVLEEEREEEEEEEKEKEEEKNEEKENNMTAKG